jgi:hypothetical protein
MDPTTIDASILLDVLIAEASHLPESGETIKHTNALRTTKPLQSKLPNPNLSIDV